MSDGGPHEPLLPYLLAPALDAGLVAGIAGAVYVAGASSAMVLAARLLGLTEQDPLDYSTTAAEWIVLALFTGVLAAWARRLGVRPTDRNEPYPAAYRLVSQLRTVSRQLSGGLDAVSLGQMLLEQTKERTALRPGGDLRPWPRRPADRPGQRRPPPRLGQLAGRRRPDGRGLEQPATGYRPAGAERHPGAGLPGPPADRRRPDDRHPGRRAARPLGVRQRRRPARRRRGRRAAHRDRAALQRGPRDRDRGGAQAAGPGDPRRHRPGARLSSATCSTTWPRGPSRTTSRRAEGPPRPGDPGRRRPPAVDLRAAQRGRPRRRPRLGGVGLRPVGRGRHRT